MQLFRLVLPAVVALLLLQRAAPGETRSGLMLRPMPADRDAALTLEINQYLQSRTDAGFEYDMRLVATRGRVLLRPEQERRSPRFGWDVLVIDTDTIDPRIPGSLVESAVAVGFGFPPLGDWRLAATLGVGFAGDEPFNGRGWYGLGSVSGTKRLSDKDILQLGVDFDGNRPIFPDAPLPVVVWTRIWGPKLSTSIGFPFIGVTWDPSDAWTLEFRGIPGVFQSGSIRYHLTPSVDVYVRYRGANFRFFVDNFQNDNRRLFYTEQRVELGLTAELGKRLKLTVAAGWALDREYSVGWDVRDTQTLTNLEETPFLGLTLTLTF